MKLTRLNVLNSQEEHMHRKCSFIPSSRVVSLSKFMPRMLSPQHLLVPNNTRKNLVEEGEQCEEGFNVVQRKIGVST